MPNQTFHDSSSVLALTEQPLLLHPYFDDPEQHLTFIPLTGALGWKTERGKRTIEVCGLNAESLRDARLEAYNTVMSSFVAATTALIQDNVAAAKPMLAIVEGHKAGSHEFAFAGRVAADLVMQRLAGLFPPTQGGN